MARIIHNAENPQKSFERVEWRYYDRIETGEYSGYCASATIYFDPAYKRHTCLLLWDVIHAGETIARVRQWLNLGNGKRPKVSRRSKYWVEWIKANGGQPPLRADRLSRTIFKNRIARILVADSASPVPYSVVREILSWETGSPPKRNQSHSNTQILNHSRKALEKTSAEKELPTSHVSQEASVLAGIEGSNQTTTQGRGDGQDHPAKASALTNRENSAQKARSTNTLPRCFECGSYAIYRASAGFSQCDTCGAVQ
jgi:hypothetical protein